MPVSTSLSFFRIGHDNGGGALSGWFLEKVIVDSPVLGIRQTFSCERWLDKNKDDGLLERELFPVDDSSYDPRTFPDGVVDR